jgi:hypothetical protein
MRTATWWSRSDSRGHRGSKDMTKDLAVVTGDREHKARREEEAPPPLRQPEGSAVAERWSAGVQSLLCGMHIKVQGDDHA